MKEEKEIRQKIADIIAEAKLANEKGRSFDCMILLEKAGVLSWTLK